MGSAVSHQLTRKGKSKTILTVGIDLAKNVFAVRGVNEAGKADLVRPAVPRDKLHELMASLPPCVVGMEACSGAHHWARLFEASGHTERRPAERKPNTANQEEVSPVASTRSPCRPVRPHCETHSVP